MNHPCFHLKFFQRTVASGHTGFTALRLRLHLYVFRQNGYLYAYLAASFLLFTCSVFNSNSMWDVGVAF